MHGLRLKNRVFPPIRLRDSNGEMKEIKQGEWARFISVPTAALGDPFIEIKELAKRGRPKKQAVNQDG